MELDEIRKSIDELDRELLPLILKRMELSARASEKELSPAEIKAREREMLRWAEERSGDMEPYIHRFYSALFELGRAYRECKNPVGAKVRAELSAALSKNCGEFPQKGTVAVQGVEGAYAQMAADRMFPRGDLMFFKSFEAVFDAVESGLCRFGVVPIENSSNGSVRANYELLNRKNLRIVRSERLFVSHELLAKPGVKLEDIREIRSHEQALGQCSEFIKSLGNRVKVQPCPNTAMAAELAARSEFGDIAAIASHSACELYGLVPIATRIQNSDNNYTRFICLSKEAEIYPGADRISLILALKHRPGALYEILAKLTALEINLIKLESCPIVGQDFQFMFFFEMQGSVRDPRVAAMLESLEQTCESFKFLGNYSEI